ncbi:MAG: hypothetical protein SWH61_17855 [Thermodesulfobacteriota bacterium]|nr:hypothetical protein [Thermodesulfobacteriota bacterium]
MKSALKISLLAGLVLAVMVVSASAELVPAESERGYLQSDLTLYELESVVGRGVISTMSPDEIREIEARGVMPGPDVVQQMVKDLYDISIKGVRIVIDSSKFSKEELVDIVNEWERALAAL